MSEIEKKDYLNNLSLIEQKEGLINGIYIEGRIPLKPLHKETIVFIHGSGMNYLSGKPIVGTFSGPEYGFKSFTFSLPGHTKSEVPLDFAKYGLENYYNDTKKVFQYLESAYNIKQDEQIIWGHSMGTLMAMEQAKRHKPAALILMNSASPKKLLQDIGVEKLYPGETPEEIEKIKKGIERGEINIKSPEKVKGYFGGELPSDYEVNFPTKYSRLLSQESNQARLDMVINPPDILPGDIRCPILLIAGSRDPAVTIENSQRLARYLKASILVVNTGHLGMFEDNWPETADQINIWLKQSLK